MLGIGSLSRAFSWDVWSFSSIWLVEQFWAKREAVARAVLRSAAQYCWCAMSGMAKGSCGWCVFLVGVCSLVLPDRHWQFVASRGSHTARHAAAQGYFPGVELEEPPEPPSRGSLIVTYLKLSKAMDKDLSTDFFQSNATGKNYWKTVAFCQGTVEGNSRWCGSWTHWGGQTPQGANCTFSSRAETSQRDLARWSPCGCHCRAHYGSRAVSQPCWGGEERDFKIYDLASSQWPKKNFFWFISMGFSSVEKPIIVEECWRCFHEFKSSWPMFGTQGQPGRGHVEAASI